jgi:hypothetical protein
MVLARLRRSSRFVAALLLASFLGLSHRASDDACAIDLLQSHDESKHVIGTPDAGAPDHCAVCHSIRTSRRPFGSIAHLGSPIVPGTVVDLPDVPFHRHPALDNRPARAPPAPLT